MTIEERARAVHKAWTDSNWNDATDVKVLADVIREAVEEERQACARIVMNGGDGQERLETAIVYGPNAAIAEAILARGKPQVMSVQNR